MFFGAQYSIVFIVGSGETLVVIAERQMVFGIQGYIGLGQKHVLLASHLIGVELRQQNCQRGRGCSAEIGHIKHLRHVGSLAVISKKEECLVLAAIRLCYVTPWFSTYLLADAPGPLNVLGIPNVAPTIMTYGTEEQKTGLLPRMLSR